MGDCEDGPKRRISRRSTDRNAKHMSLTTRTGKAKGAGTIQHISPEKKSDWFCNSFNSRQEKKKLKSSPDRKDQFVPVSSTPKASKRTKSIDEANELDTSDALLADLDLDTVQPQMVPKCSVGSLQTNHQDLSRREEHRLIKVQEVKNVSINDHQNEQGAMSCHVLKTEMKENQNHDTTNITQSLYFESKFQNYKATQPKNMDNNGEISISQVTATCDSSVADTTTEVPDKSVFSFSFVGNDTVCVDGDDSMVIDSPVKPVCNRRRVTNLLNNTRTCIYSRKPDYGYDKLNEVVDLANNKLSEANVPTDTQNKVDLTSNKLQWCPDRFQTSTQVVKRIVVENADKTPTDSYGNHGRKFHCTPYRSDDTLVDSQLDVSGLTQSIMPTAAETTQLNDKSVTVKYRCTPYKQQASDNGSLTQPDSQCSLLEMASVISQPNSKIQKGHQDMTNTEGQYLAQQSQVGDLQPTPICDMTGLILDSQCEVKGDKDQNDSYCDMFGDSFQDNPDLMTQIDKMEEKFSQISQRSNVKVDVDTADLSSHTQSIGVEGKTARNKRTLDDDIEDIFNASQKRRNLGYKTERLVLETNNGKAVVLNKSDISYTSHTRKSTALISNNNNTFGHCEINSGEGDLTSNKENSMSNLSHSAIVYNSKGNGDSTGDSINKAVTPKTGSLQDRIKQRLKHNAGQRTPQGPISIIDQLREQVLERAQLEAEMVKESVRNDVGPFYGLPSKVKDLFAQYRGITTLYDWQDECLKLPAVLNRKNLIYSLPTSGGKTLVAEILILQELLCQKRDALLILPFVSIVQEKVRNMSQFAIDLNFHVEEYAGSKGRFPPTKRRKSRSLFIATIEKAHSIVNSLIEEDRLESLGLVVVDELHMIGEGGSRGATMESTLIKLLHASSQLVHGPTQIIGMSATLNNIEDLQKFLHAEIYSNDFRPVKLTENIKISDSIYRIDQTAKCTEDRFVHERVVCFQYCPEMERTDPNHLLGLALEVIPDNSCLIFCPTKKNCENVALMLCKMLVKMKSELSSVKRNERKMLLKELYNDSDGKICPVLQYTLHFGVAYHHSGLTMDERKLIEEAYSSGVLCLLTCTSTLAAGVNLPAKRVILKSPYVGKTFISRSQYKQMVGRAGRAGIDTTGESVLICQQNDREKVCDLLDRPLEKCHSSLVYDGGKGIRNFILSAVGLKIATKTEEVFTIFGRSLMQLHQDVLKIDVNRLVQESLQKLIDHGLVTQLKNMSEDPESNEFVHSLEVTDLGKATFKGPVDPDYACMLYEDLKKDECLVISTHLHLLYLVTPYDLVEDITPSWFIYHNQMSTLSPAELKVANIIGVSESYITIMASVQKSRKKVNPFVIKRFYLTLMLYELWCQKTVWEVAERFQLHRGYIQNLLSSAASFASCVSRFCQEMSEFWAYQDLMGNFVKRLSYCVTAELIPLMEIPGVKLGRARLMYNAGFRTLSSVATCDVEKLVQNVQYMPRKVAKQIVASAKLLLNEKAEVMLEEVEELVAIPTNITSENQPMNIPTPMPVTPGQSQNSIESEIR